MSPNNTAELQQQLAEALMERDEARRERDAYKADSFYHLEKATAAEAARETLRGYVQHMEECGVFQCSTLHTRREHFSENCEAKSLPCTCGLAACLAAATPTEK